MHPIWEWSDHSLILFFGWLGCNTVSVILRDQERMVLSTVYFFATLGIGVWLLVDVT